VEARTDAPDTSTAGDADVLEAPAEAPDVPVPAADEHQPSKTPDTVSYGLNEVADQDKLPESGPDSDSVPTIEELPPDSAGRHDETTVWSRHRRLSSVAVACAVAVVAAVVPFTLISLAHSPSPAPSSTPAHSLTPTSSPHTSQTQGQGSSTYTRVSVDLPAAYRGTLSSMAFSPDGTTLAVAGGVGAGQACLWNIATARCTANFPIAHSIAFSPDGTTVAVTNSDSGTADQGSVRLWDVATGKRTAILTDGQSQGAYSAAFRANGKTLVVGDANGSIYLWDVATRTQTTSINSTNHAGFAAVACSPVGSTMAAGDVDGTTYLVNVATKPPQEMFTVTTSTATATDPQPLMVNSLAFSHDGTTLAIGDINGTIALINMETRRPIATLYDPGSKGVESVAFSPNDAAMAVADANGSTYLWSVATRKVIATLPDPGSGGVTSVAFSPNGKILATGDEDGSANLWHGNFRLSIIVINVSCFVTKVSW
jgi:WD40 repeat protein